MQIHGQAARRCRYTAGDAAGMQPEMHRLGWQHVQHGHVDGQPGMDPSTALEMEMHPVHSWIRAYAHLCVHR